LKRVIIDGANVATVNNPKRRLSSRIEIAIGQLDPYADCVKAVLPSYWVKKSGVKIEDPEILEKLLLEDKISLIHKQDDDYYMIQYCVETNAFLLSNDKLRNHRKEEWWTTTHEEWVETHLLDFEIIDDTVVLSKVARKQLTHTPIEPPTLGVEMIAETG